MDRAVYTAHLFRFGLFEADVARGTLTRSGVRVKIQDQPFQVLLLLLECAGEIVTREEIRQTLWPQGTYVDFDGSLNVILAKLRATLRDDSDNPTFIETIPRRGYRFIAPVLVESQSPIAAAEDSNDGAQILQPVNETGSRPYMYVAVALGLLMVGGLAWIALQWRQGSAKPFNLALEASAKAPVRRSIAVLGFHNVSGKLEDAWLSTAFSEMLSTELSGGEKLRLVTGEEVANLRVSSPWPQTDTLDSSTTSRIGNALDSDLLILGSYTAVGKSEQGEVRLDVRLQNSKTGEILTEIAQTGDRRDLFRLVAAVGVKLRTRLGLPQLAEPDEASVVASLPANREAGRFYALGLAKLREFDALAARDLLQQACKADPKFALGHAMLARAWSQLGYEQKHREEAKKALDLSKDLPRAERMLVEGDYYESLADHEKAASTYRALFELFPDNVEYGLQLASAQAAAGHASQVSQTLAQLRRLPPPASEDPRIDLMDAREAQTNVPARLALIQDAIRKSSVQGKKLVYAWAKEEECMKLMYGDHPDQAVSSCQEAYNIFLAAGNRLGAADSVRLMGDAQGTEGHSEQAIATYERALTMLQQLGEDRKIGSVLNNMAIDLENEGQLDRAEQLYRQAKVHFERAGDKSTTAIALGNIGDILYLRGDLPGAAKLYQQALEIQASLDHAAPGYFLYRLGDVRWAQGNVQDAYRLAQQAIDIYREGKGSYQYLTGAMLVLEEALESEGDLQGAKQLAQQTVDIRQKMGEMGLVRESQVVLANLALEEGHPNQSEPLLRAAIVDFEKEKGNPATTGAYTSLSRALLSQGKVDEARKAIQHAAELGHDSPDPELTLPIAIQTARVEGTALEQNSSGHTSLARARQRLHSTIDTARKLGYYQIECEARFALTQLEMMTNPELGRSLSRQLGDDAHRHGLELIFRKAADLAGHRNEIATAFR